MSGIAPPSPVDLSAPRPLTDRVLLVRTQAHEAIPTAIVRVDGAPPQKLLVGQTVAGRGVVEHIAPGSIAIRDGALVYVILIAPTAASESPAQAAAR